MSKAIPMADSGKWWDVGWNPVTGCTPCSPACENCYAKRMAETRLRGRCGYSADEPFRVTMHPERLEQPLRWRKKPRTVFVCDMSDLFHPDIPEHFFNAVWAVMWACVELPLRFLVLTKRANRMLECIDRIVDGPLPNVMLGVSVWDQESADENIPRLLECPAAGHFVSYEPALSPVYFRKYWFVGPKPAGSGFLDWVIVGGETGPGARPMDADWARGVRNQCRTAEVPFWMKQMSRRAAIPDDLRIREKPEMLKMEAAK